MIQKGIGIKMSKGFYNCDACGWSGSKLTYFGIDGDDNIIDIYKEHNQLGQGVCPMCHTVFQGSVHPLMPLFRLKLGLPACFKPTLTEDKKGLEVVLIDVFSITVGITYGETFRISVIIKTDKALSDCSSLFKAIFLRASEQDYSRYKFADYFRGTVTCEDSYFACSNVEDAIKIVEWIQATVSMSVSSFTSMIILEQQRDEV